MTDADLNRSLRFAVIALRDGYIDRPRFAEVWAAWTVKMDEPIGDLVVRGGFMTIENRRELDRRAEQSLEANRSDTDATLRDVYDTATIHEGRVLEHPEK
jgi:hypothetical protein